MNEGAAPLLAALRGGAVSAEAVVGEHLQLLRDAHAVTNAVVDLNDARALADARALDGSFARNGVVGPLHGLPVTVKDWIDVEGFSCAGETSDRGRRPARDAAAVARLRAAGAVVIGKTRVWGSDEHGDRVRHPVDPGRSVGGSSSGEAALVAYGASPLGLGSDSGGSIRLPAAWCGVYGLKPTAGRVPTTGHYPRVGALSDGRTQIGPIARSLDDIELALGVISGPDRRDAGVAPVPLRSSLDVDVRDIRFAITLGEGEWCADAATAAEVESAAGALESAGATRVGGWMERWLADAWDITDRYWGREELSGAEVGQQLRDWDGFRSRYLEATQDVDVLLMPAVAEPAPTARKITATDFVFTLPASLTGSPALSAPSGTDPSGLPLAVQLVGRPWEEDRVLACARLLAPG